MHRSSLWLMNQTDFDFLTTVDLLYIYIITMVTSYYVISVKYAQHVSFEWKPI